MAVDDDGARAAGALGRAAVLHRAQAALARAGHRAAISRVGVRRSTVRPLSVKSIGPPCRRQHRTVWPYATAPRALDGKNDRYGLRVPCGPYT